MQKALCLQYGPIGREKVEPLCVDELAISCDQVQALLGGTILHPCLSSSLSEEADPT